LNEENFQIIVLPAVSRNAKMTFYDNLLFMPRFIAI